MRFRAEPSRHQDCRTVFASFARLNHSGPITFYAEMGMFPEPSRRVLQEQSSTPKSTQVRTVPERGNQGQTQHKGTAAGTAGGGVGRVADVFLMCFLLNRRRCRMPFSRRFPI